MRLLDWFRPKKLGEKERSKKNDAKVTPTDFKKQTAFISPQWKLKRLKTGAMTRRCLTSQIPKGWKRYSKKAQESLWKERV